MPDNAAAALAVVIYLAALDAADLVVASAAVSVVALAMALASYRMSRSRMATLRCTLVDRVAVLAVMAVLVLVAGREEPVLVLVLQAMAAVLEPVAGKEVLVSVADAALADMAVVPELAAAGKAVLVADAVLAAMAAVLAGRELELVLELVLELAPMPGDHRLSSTTL